MAKRILAGAATAILLTASLSPAIAEAGWHGGHHGRHHGGGYFGFSFYSPPEPIWVEPQPVYYEPPPPNYPGLNSDYNLPNDNWPNGRYCREYNTTAYVGGRPQPTYGTACMQPDGSWQMID